VVASVGSRGDPYDNAMGAEAYNSTFKAELVRNNGPWRDIDDLQIATMEYVDWYNHRRLHGELGRIPPVEYETNHHNKIKKLQDASTTVDARERGLHRTRALTVTRQGHDDLAHRRRWQ
jgi:putative transposase